MNELYSQRTQRSGSAGKRRKRAQRIRDFARSAGARSVEAVSDEPPAAPSFPSCRKRRGRKGRLDAFGAYCGCYTARNMIYRYYEHTYSPYERYGTRRLLRSNWTCELVPLNECGKSALRSKVAGQYGFAETPTMLFRGILNHFELVQLLRERSKKTEAFFLVALKGVPGRNRNLPGLVFFWRGKRKCCAAPANGQKGFCP